MSLFEELKRRNVFRVAIAYVLLGWAVLQGADFLLDLVGAPEWVIRVFAIAGLVGFPFAVFFAWAFELTPEGVKREKDIDRSQSITPQTGRKLNGLIVGLLLLVIVLMGVERVFFATGIESGEPQANAEVPKSVAVLPFVNMSADPEQEYFSDGMTEEIINALVRVPGIKVAARTSVFVFKNHQEDIRTIGQELGVSHVVEGSVRSDGQQLRITAQLIQVSDGFHIWSETFDRPRANVFAIQEEIAGAIAGVLNERLSTRDAKPEVPRVGVKAYDDYLRGRALLRERTTSSMAQARVLFESVTASDPGYAPGWAALAITADVQDDNEVAESAALRALQLDPDNVDAMTALGGVYRDTRRWAQAEEQFSRAMALDPDSAELLEDYGEFLARTGRMDELLEVTSRGYAVDPYLTPLVEVYAVGLMASGNAERAVEVLRATIERGNSNWLNAALAAALIQMGDKDGLRSMVTHASLPDADRAMFLAALDRPNDAAAVSKVEALYSAVHSGAFNASNFLAEIVLLYLGRYDALIASYTAVYSNGADPMDDYWFLPVYAGLRADPGFGPLLERTGLPEYWDQAGWPDFCRRQNESIVCS